MVMLDQEYLTITMETSLCRGPYNMILVLLIYPHFIC